MKALLIIDIQKVSFTTETPRYDAINVIKRINKLSALFRQKGDLVIYIQHDGSAMGFCKPETKEWEILDSLVREPNDIILPKTANDAFYNTNLEQFLKENKIDELVITGCATDFCVDATVKGGITKDFNITVISDAHTTADRDNITAKQVIDHYNWIWSEYLPTQGKITLAPFNDYIKKVI